MHTFLSQSLWFSASALFPYTGDIASPELSTNHSAPAACLLMWHECKCNGEFMTLDISAMLTIPTPPPPPATCGTQCHGLAGAVGTASSSKIVSPSSHSPLCGPVCLLACYLLCLILSQWLNPIGLEGMHLGVLGPLCGPRPWPVVPHVPSTCPHLPFWPCQP